MVGLNMRGILEPWGGQERCGVWFKEAGVFEIKNAALDPTVSFKLSALDIYDLSNQVNEDAEGIWHSHPDGKPQPSQTDYDFHPVGFKLAIVERGVWRTFDPETRVEIGSVRMLENGEGEIQWT